MGNKHVFLHNITACLPTMTVQTSQIERALQLIFEHVVCKKNEKTEKNERCNSFSHSKTVFFNILLKQNAKKT